MKSFRELMEKEELTRSDYKLTPSGRKTHKYITMNSAVDGEEEKEQEEKDEEENRKMKSVKEEVSDVATIYKKIAVKHLKDMMSKNVTQAQKIHAKKMHARALEASKMSNHTDALNHYRGMKEQAPVAPTLDKKYIKGTPENKAYKASKKPINSVPTNKMKEETEEQAADRKKQLKKFKDLMTPGQSEVVTEALDTYEMATAHKDKASKALETSDMSAFHHHMSNHHESMGQWHESKGRHSSADREYAKAEDHHEKSLTASTMKKESAACPLCNDDPCVCDDAHGFVSEGITYHPNKSSYGNRTSAGHTYVGHTTNTDGTKHSNIMKHKNGKYFAAGGSSTHPVKSTTFHDTPEEAAQGKKASMKEEVELDEAIKIGSKVKIHAPGKDYHDQQGYVGEIRHGLYKGAPKTYTVDYGDSKSIQLRKNNVKLHKEEVELNEVNHREFAQASKMHPTMAKFMTKGKEMDFYHSKTGDKISGVVTKNDGKAIHLQANKGGKIGGGETHKFAVSKNLGGEMHEEAELDEVLDPSMGAGEYINDFQKSKAPQFKNKSKEKRRMMGIAAYLQAKRAVKEELQGKQHKLDKNKNGKLDADDFKKLRTEEEIIEEIIDEGDELNIRHQVVLNKTPAGKAREVKRNREHLKMQMKATKSMGGLAGPKGKLPEEVEELDDFEYTDTEILEGRITARKHGGNDDYSWAVFVDGHPAVTGLSKREVPYHKERAAAALKSRSDENKPKPKPPVKEGREMLTYREFMEATWPDYSKDNSDKRFTGAGARHDIKDTGKGVIATRRFDKSSETAAEPTKTAEPPVKRGRGRPAGTTGTTYKARTAEVAAAARAKAAATKAANKNKKGE